MEISGKGDGLKAKKRQYLRGWVMDPDFKDTFFQMTQTISKSESLREDIFENKLCTPIHGHT